MQPRPAKLKARRSAVGSFFLVGAVLWICASSRAVTPTRAELDERRRWTSSAFEESGADPLCSFRLDGRSSRDLLKDWNVQRSSEKLDETRIRRTITWRQPGEGLIVRCEGVEYADFPVVEWTVYLKNTSPADSGIIEDLRAVDLTLRRDAGGEFLLHHNTGSPCTPTDYQPHETRLSLGESKRIATTGGRPTNSDLPFFNIECGSGRGAIVALGWPGQWAA